MSSHSVLVLIIVQPMALLCAPPQSPTSHPIHCVTSSLSGHDSQSLSEIQKTMKFKRTIISLSTVCIAEHLYSRSNIRSILYAEVKGVSEYTMHV